MSRRILLFGVLVAFTTLGRAPAGAPQQDAVAAKPAKPVVKPVRPWAAWLEPDAPFFSSIVDGANAGPAFPNINLTPRGIVLRLGNDLWAAFDTDLLRVAALWRGDGVTAAALAPGSYHTPDKKTPNGQYPAPEPDGTVWLANGIYPGWQKGTRVSLDDPREPAPTPAEVGRGPLPEAMGRFNAIRMTRSGAVLEYSVAGVEVREWITSSAQSSRPVAERYFTVQPSTEQLMLVLGVRAKEMAVVVTPSEGEIAALETVRGSTGELLAVRIKPHAQPVAFTVAMGPTGTMLAIPPKRMPSDAAAARWPQEVTTRVTRSVARQAYVVDEVALPLDNPWRRDIRISDIQFLPDGTGAGVTLDGDVWLVRGLHQDRPRWRRFASGLHEPLTLAIRDGQIYVFDRNGIWRLRDTDGNGEADLHALFSNAFAQTADMREFPNTIRLGPNGEFVIAKGNQEATTIGKHNGRVLRVSADGRRIEVLGYGFRQPNLAVNVRTGLVTASDQQGNYVPSTPLHIVRDNQFYGFISTKLPREVYPAPIADPLTWIPHSVNASAISQVWLFDARMGSLNDALIHIGFNRPEIFRVLLNDRGTRPQAAVVSITRAFRFPPLNGSVNPADGQLYLAGFQIIGWGTTATSHAGVGRVRYTGAASTLPRELVPMDKGILLRFDVPLAAKQAVDPRNYSLASWQYLRTYKYGSPQLKADGTPGIDTHAASRAYLSRDGRSVFIAVPGLKPVMQMRLQWSLATATGRPFSESAYFTPYELTPFDPAKEGFEPLRIELTAAPAASPPPAGTRADTVSAANGRGVYEQTGCMACHAIASGDVRLGPTLKGLYGRERQFPGIGPVVADDGYLREAILEPTVKTVPGYERGEVGMPSYAGVLTEQQVESLILFIKSLK